MVAQCIKHVANEKNKCTTILNAKELLHGTVQQVISNCDEEKLNEAIVHSKCHEDDRWMLAHYFAFTLHANRYDNAYRNQAEHLQTDKREELQAKLASNKKGANIISTYLNNESPEPFNTC